MSKPTKTILITGFGPFPGAPDNPSSLLIQALADLPPHNPHDDGLIYKELPTDWTELPKSLSGLIDRYSPDLSVHIGYAQSSPGFQLESTAYNETCDLVDVAGTAGPCSPVCDQSPAQIQSALPLENIRRELRSNGFKAELSDDPGRYLCNMVYYLALHRSPNRSALFVHIPAISATHQLVPHTHEGENVLTREEAIQGIRVILDLLRHPADIS